MPAPARGPVGISRASVGGGRALPTGAPMLI